MNITPIGYITKIDIEKNKISIYCFENSSDSFYNTKTKNFKPHTNTLVKIQTGFNIIILKIIGSQYIRDKSTGKENYKQFEAIIYGSFKNDENLNFVKGNFGLPIILGARVFELNFKELQIINNSLKFKNEYIIGKDLENENFDVKTDANIFFASHIGIFGNTGSGKSVTLAKIFKDLISKSLKFKVCVKLFLFDYNNEYKNSFVNSGESAPSFEKIIYLNKNTNSKIKINFQDLDGDIWCNVLDATLKTQAPLIKRAWEKYKEFTFNNEPNNENYEEIKFHLLKTLSQIILDNNLNLFTKFKNLINDFSDIFQNKLQQTKFIENLNRIKITKVYGNGSTKIIDSINDGGLVDKIHELEYTTLINLLEEEIFKDINFKATLNKGINLFTFFVLNAISFDDNKNEWLLPIYNKCLMLKKEFDSVFTIINEKDEKDFFDLNNKAINIFQIQDFNNNVKSMVVNLVSSLIYKKILNKEKNEVYTNIIIDEAHNLTTKKSDEENLSSLNILKKIIREGRKYGLFLTLASQRPSDIPTDILSQIHNFLIHKLINNKDIEMIKSTNSYVNEQQINLLPNLVPGQCLISGTAFEDPKFVKIELNENLPSSENIKIF